MKIGLRGGHSANCIGAIGVVNEYDQMQKYFVAVKNVLEKYGHTVIDCNSNGSSANAELSEGASKANNTGVDLFISLHMNAFNGSAYGTECVISSTSSGSYKYATKICSNFEKLGFRNRGVKCEKLYEMNHITAPNIIFEICFCDSQSDIDIYNKYSWEQLSHALCNSIDNNIPFSPSASESKMYIVTDYLKGGYKGDGSFEDVDIDHYHSIIGNDVKIYAKGDARGVWLTTERLSKSKCEEVKQRLGSLFYSMN